MFLKYIGPFFRLNSLNRDNIKNQLFYLSKEAVKEIVLNSKCGITFPINELKTKDIPLNDINTFKGFSPLACLYKKASCSLYDIDDHLYWDESKPKTDILISSNAYMTLCILELSEYLSKFKEVHPKKTSLSGLYLGIAKKQLDFYAAHLRNMEGVFVDKKDTTDDIDSEIKLEEKNNAFKFSDQALIMCAYYKFSQLYSGKTSIQYQNFSFDILKMFLQFKDDLYNLSPKELNKLIFALNIFFEYSKDTKCYELLMDLYEYTIENHVIECSNNISNLCLLNLNSIILHKNSGIVKFKDKALEAYSAINNLYSSEYGMLLRNEEKKEIAFYSTEIFLYILNAILVSDLGISNKEIDDSALIEIFKHQLIESGIIATWPAAPPLDDPEHYKNFSLRSDDLIEECNFKMPTLPTPKAGQMAPIFFKKVIFNKRKRTFSTPKKYFYSDNNMFIFFLSTYFFKDNFKL